MYHCHINFFFLGSHRRLFKQIEAMAPLENFTHEYFESKTPYESMISKADVILTWMPMQRYGRFLPEKGMTQS